MRQPFRGCGSNADCPLPGDECALHVNRKCAGATDSTGRIDAPLSRTGTAGRATQVQVAAFCLAATRSSAVNLAAGLPGPVALRLPTSACAGDVCP